MIKATTVVKIASGYRLQWEAAQQTHVLLYPEGVVTLNASAADILSRCNGQNTLDDIVTELQFVYPDAKDLPQHINEFVNTAIGRGWLIVVAGQGG